MAHLSRRERWRDPGVAASYDARRFQGPLQRIKHRRDVSLILDILAAAGPPGLVLDLPCGTGRLAPGLSQAGYRVLGADVSLPMLERARARAPLVPLIQADGKGLPLATDSVDVVVSLRYLFHLHGPRERCAFLGELARVSRGHVIGQVRYRQTLKHGGRWLRHRVGLRSKYVPSSGRREIAEELSQAGLELRGLWPLSRLFSDKALFLASGAGSPVGLASRKSGSGLH